MRVGFFGFSNGKSPHHETDLELIEEHLEAGDDVFYYKCRGQLASCYTNRTHRLRACMDCISQREIGLSLCQGAKGTSERFHLRSVAAGIKVPDDVRSEIDVLPDREAAYSEWSVENARLGRSVISSLVSFFRSTQVDFRSHRSLARSMCMSSAFLYFNTLENIERDKLDRIVVFNGRFFDSHAVWSAAIQKGIEVWLHDCGADQYRYGVFEGVIHDRKHLAQRILAFSRDLSHEELVCCGEEFYARQRYGRNTEFSYTKGQRKDMLPAGWAEGVRHIVIFTTSEDEFLAAGEGWTEGLIYPSQAEGIIRICQGLGDDATIQTIIRCHPNSARTKSPEMDGVAMRVPNSTIYIQPNSPCDTYALLDKADVVVTFGSTVGVEATYWGKPSVLLGRAMYEELEVCHMPESHEAALAMLRDPKLAVRSRQGTLCYGAYWSRFGTRFQRYRPTGRSAGHYHGRNIAKFEGESSTLRKIRMWCGWLPVRAALRMLSLVHRWWLCK